MKATLSLEEPDRVPVSADYVPEIRKKLSAVLKNGECDLEVNMGNDMVLISHGFDNGYYFRDDAEYRDEWGCKWKRFQTPSGSYTEVIERPLADEKKLASYEIPNPYDEKRYEPSRKIIESMEKFTG